MEGPPLGPGGEDITWPDQVAPRGRKASSTSKIKPQTSNLLVHQCRAVGSAVRCSAGGRGGGGGGPAVASAPHGREAAAIYRHWEGRRGSHAAHASRHSPESGAWPRALGPQGVIGWCRGDPH